MDRIYENDGINLRQGAVLGHIHLKLAIFTTDTLGFCAIPVIGLSGTLVFTIAEVVIHLCLEHLLYRAGERVFEGVLDVFCGLNVILLQQPLDKVTLSFSHWSWFVNFFFSVCHNLRPPMI